MSNVEYAVNANKPPTHKGKETTIYLCKAKRYKKFSPPDGEYYYQRTLNRGLTYGNDALHVFIKALSEKVAKQVKKLAAMRFVHHERNKGPTQDQGPSDDDLYPGSDKEPGHYPFKAGIFPRLAVKDLSYKKNVSKAPGHASHNKGRDVDIGFYYANNRGLTIVSVFRSNKRIYRDLNSDEGVVWHPRKGVKSWILSPLKREGKLWDRRYKAYRRKGKLRWFLRPIPDWDLEANYILFTEAARLFTERNELKAAELEAVFADALYKDQVYYYAEYLLILEAFGPVKLIEDLRSLDAKVRRLREGEADKAPMKFNEIYADLVEAGQGELFLVFSALSRGLNRVGPCDIANWEELGGDIHYVTERGQVEYYNRDKSIIQPIWLNEEVHYWTKSLLDRGLVKAPTAAEITRLFNAPKKRNMKPNMKSKKAPKVKRKDRGATFWRERWSEGVLRVVGNHDNHYHFRVKPCKGKR